MIDRPVFHAHITVRVLDPNTVLLLLEDEGEERLLKGASCGRIAQRIDGNHTVDEILDEFQDQLAPQEIYYVLQRFESGGYLTSADSKVPSGISSFWRMHGADPESAIEILRNTAVSLRAMGAMDTGELWEALSRLGIRISEGAGFSVVLTDDYLNKDLHAWNAEMLSRRGAWMIAKPLGQTQWLGPIFRPGVTGCWCCLAHRLRENRKVPEFRTSCAALPSAVSAFVNMIATEVAKWLVAGRSEPLEGAVWTMDSHLVTTTHYLTRQPQCHCCADGALDVSKQGFALQSRGKHPSVRGSHRATTAEETIRKLERHISPITGVIPIIRKTTLATNPAAHVYVALQNSVLSFDGPSGAIGKGMNDAEAMASCLAEAVERYSCCFRGTEPCIRASYADLAPDAVSPVELLSFSERQYREREDWNQRHGSFQWVPERFEEALEIDWTPVWSLSRQRERYVPTAYCYFPYPRDDGRFFSNDSNGCASGNTLEEAVLQGLLELVERDAVALWWYNRISRPAVDLVSFQDPFLSATVENLRRVGRTIHVLDLANDLGIPAFAAASWRRDGSQIVLGSAADVDPRIGVVRAVSELNQVLELADREEDHADPRGRDLSLWLRTAKIEEHRYLVGSGKIHARDLQSLSSNDILTDINCLKDILGRHGLEVLLLDMTRPDIGFPVVRVIVPGLRHFWARLGPGRLYDVPRQLSWTTKRISEAELNPIPYML